MKTPRFHISIVMAAAIGTLVLIVSTAQAGPLKRFGRFRHSERDSTSLTNDNLKGTVNVPARRVPVPPGYPRYRLVDLGTLGGSNSSQVFPAVNLNDRGDVIAFSSTDTLDPYPFTIQDEFIWHGILSNASGVVRDLGALPGDNQSLAGGISRDGLIAGFSSNGLLDPLTDFPQVRAVMWDSARNIHDLGTLGGNTSQASQVNSRSQVAGFATNAVPEDPDVALFFNGFLPAAQQVRAFLWENGSMRDLGSLGGNDSMAVLINETGAVCGISSINTQINDTTGLPTTHPFVWTNGQMRDLGALGGTLATTGSLAFGPWGKVMNDHGDVAGTSTLPGDDVWHAFVWSNGRMTDLGTLGGSKSDAFAINNKGQVVGRAVVTDTPFVRHAFLWEKGQMSDLGAVAPCTRSTATSINSANQIVGELGFCTEDPNDIAFFSAFYVEKGKPMVDLNTLITPPSPIHLDDASFINERGEIAADGLMPDGSTRAVLLVPVR